MEHAFKSLLGRRCNISQNKYGHKMKSTIHAFQKKVEGPYLKGIKDMKSDSLNTIKLVHLTKEDQTRS